MNLDILTMALDDYDEVRALWEATPGVGLDDSDSRQAIARYLERNPGLSCLARRAGVLVGAVICSYDGRRGYLSHLAVHGEHQGQGVGRALVDACLQRLHRHGIQKTNVRVYVDNSSGIAFWRRMGFVDRHELKVLTKTYDPPVG